MSDEAAFDLNGFVSEEDLETVLFPLVPFKYGRALQDGRPLLRTPDLTIAPDGVPYLYRWHMLPRNNHANVYLHLQVGDDPERPLHDHQYDNQSVILAGGYVETYILAPDVGSHNRDAVTRHREVRAGRTIHRRAEEAHRLRLLPDASYAITLFTTGPRIREWGFWTEMGWVPWTELLATDDQTGEDYRKSGVSKWKGV